MLGKEYALALFQFGEDLDKVSVFQEQFQTLVEVVKENQDLVEVLDHPLLKVEEKKSILSEALKQFDSDFVYFIYVVIDNGRFDVLKEMYNEYIKLMNEISNIMVVDVYHTPGMKLVEMSALKDKLEQQYQKTVELVLEQDDTLIDGFRLEFGGKVLDVSMRATLNELKSKLL